MNKQNPNRAEWWLLGTLMMVVFAFFIIVMLLASEAKAQTTPGVAYCSLYAREATRIDLMHTIPVKPENVGDEYIEQLAVQVFKQCVSVLPTLLPLPAEHRNLGTWVNDMRRMLIERAGTAPAVANDDEWRAQCRTEYKTWDEATGTVVRSGSDARVPCPCGKEVTCD